MAETEHDDLRTRRRRETREHVSAVAIALFEAHGVAATTVDAIAAEAGISPRTFFRYFATKEDAALLGFVDVADAVADLDLDGADAQGIVERIVAMHDGLLAAAEEENLARFLALQALIQREPSLRDAAIAHMETTAQGLQERAIAALGDSSRLEARLAAELGVVALRAAIDEWTSGESGDLVALHRRAAALLPRLGG